MNHNLLDLIPPTATQSVAGPSRHRPVAPARTTRRQAHERSEVFAAPIITPAPVATTPPVDIKGKGKAKEEEVIQPFVAKPRGRGRPSAATLAAEAEARLEYEQMVEMAQKKSKGGRRKTISFLGSEVIEDEGQVADVTEERAPIGGKKKRPRNSLPNLPLSKKTRGTQLEVKDEVESSPAVETPFEIVEEVAEPAPEEQSLPSLAHIPFPPPPVRPHERRSGPNRMWYTDPIQLPPSNTKYQGDIRSYLSSYIHIEDTGPQPDLATLEARAARVALVRNRVNWLLHQGRMLRLLDEEEGAGPAKTKGPAPPPRQADHQEHLMNHMVQVRNAMMNEAKAKPLVCKKVARMITAYWEHIEGREERERAAEDRDMKRRQKELVKALKKRWGLAVKVCSVMPH